MKDKRRENKTCLVKLDRRNLHFFWICYKLTGKCEMMLGNVSPDAAASASPLKWELLFHLDFKKKDIFIVVFQRLHYWKALFHHTFNFLWLKVNSQLF